MFNFHRIGHRILFVVGIVVALGLAAVILLYANQQEQSILEQNERSLVKVTQSVSAGLKAVMLKGYADVAHVYGKRLRAIKGTVDYRILRIDGREAFIDNETTLQVNQSSGSDRFKLRPELTAEQVIAPTDPRLAQLLADQKRQLFYDVMPGIGSVVTVLEPVLADRACMECHKSGAAVRGVIKLTTSLSTVENDIRDSWLMSIGMVSVGVLFIFTAVYFIAKRSVVNPIQAVVQAMAVAAKGDLSVKIPVTGNDEISRMAESFNQMSGQLGQLYEGLQDEQNKLTTIILGSNEGIVVTDPNNNVVLVNPAASEILGKSRERILEEGILMLVDDPEWMQLRIAARKHNELAGVIEFNGRILSIEASTTKGTSGHITGSAAIVRDVTEETRLAAELKRLAVTDGLTGLYNRRHFDEVMESEFKRARRYKTHFSVILLDIDYFKNFNDTYGHDCGDRVLKAIGVVLRDVAARQWPESKVHASKVGIACRYGGEELTIVLPELSRAEAAIVAETARREIAELRVDGMQVTASLGVAECSESHQQASDMVVSADEALYRAKEAGRNCVMLGH